MVYIKKETNFCLKKITDIKNLNEAYNMILNFLS